MACITQDLKFKQAVVEYSFKRLITTAKSSAVIAKTMSAFIRAIRSTAWRISTTN